MERLRVKYPIIVEGRYDKGMSFRTRKSWPLSGGWRRRKRW